MYIAENEHEYLIRTKTSSKEAQAYIHVFWVEIIIMKIFIHQNAR